MRARPLFILGVLAVPGLFFLYHWPCLSTAMQRSRQKREMADIRAIAAAWEARAVLTHTFGIQPRKGNVVAAADLERALVPTYIRAMPLRDAWNDERLFTTDGTTYEIRSLGKDGRIDHGTGATTSFDCDVVFANGAFVEWPDGISTTP